MKSIWRLKNKTLVRYSATFVNLRCCEARLRFISNTGSSSTILRSPRVEDRFRQRWHVWRVKSASWGRWNWSRRFSCISCYYLFLVHTFARLSVYIMPLHRIYFSYSSTSDWFSCEFLEEASLTFRWVAPLSMASSDLSAGSRDARCRTWASGPSRWIDTSIRWPRNFSELEIFHRCRAISPLDCFVINVYARGITLSFCFAPCYFVICRDACHHLLNFSASLGSSAFPPFARLSSETETRGL